MTEHVFYQEQVFGVKSYLLPTHRYRAFASELGVEARLSAAVSVSVATPMAVDEARSALEAVVEEAGEGLVTSQETLAQLRGAKAIYDQTRDAGFRALPSFERAAAAIAALPDFPERFGAESAERVTLQIVYDYFDGVRELGVDLTVFTEVFDRFLAELSKATWTLVLLANLKRFESGDSLIDFGDGMTIRARSLDEVRERLGWNDFHIAAFVDDWSGFGASDHVIWFEEELEKTPETLVRSNTPTSSDSLARLFFSLWLYKQGDVNVGSVFMAESSSFSLRGGGIARLIVPWAVPPGRSFGDTTYSLAASEAREVRAVYDSLVQFDNDTNVPQNVRLAFRRFASIYARGLHQREDRVLDSITALEALLGAKVESTFKLSFRIASILADDDADRADLLLQMKQFYATRSRVVHGGKLRQQDHDLIADDTPLRSVLRRVLHATLQLAVDHRRHLTEGFVNEELDQLLIHGGDRDALRRQMGIA